MSSVSNTITSAKNAVQPYARPTATVVLGLDGTRRIVHAFQTRAPAQPIQQINPEAAASNATEATAVAIAKPAKLSYDVLSRFSLTSCQQAVVGTAEIITAIYLGLKK